MGRYKNIEIQGLLINDFEKNLIDGLENAIKNSKKPKDEVLKKLGPKFEKLLHSYEEKITTIYLQNRAPQVDFFLKTSSKNQKKISGLYKSSFEWFILYINGCYNIYEKIINKIERKRIDSTLKMNVALYGLIIRRADEILNQLISGYIDGAMILWRSLYENAIILLVLAAENNTELADKYYKHSLRNSNKKIKSYKKNFEELNFGSISKSTEINLQKKLDRLNETYGKSFIENEYGWADSLFEGKQKANFMLLEERVEMNKYRPYYLLCCEQVHSNFNSFINFMDGKKIVLPWLVVPKFELDVFIDPMQFTVSILNDINDYILYEFSIKEEYNANLLLMQKIFEKQQATFRKPKKKS